MFSIEKKLNGKLGRAGLLVTPHGTIETPAFVAVGTKATVKAVTPAQIKETGAQVVLANTYHLYLKPGERIIRQAGGLGKFMGWSGPTMTDSGGFQVFSLGAVFGQKVGKVKKDSDTLRASDSRCENQMLVSNTNSLAKIDEDGVTFKSYKDGSSHRFTPERSIEIQHTIGADIIFAFDECTSPDAPKEYQREAMNRTHRWAARSLERHAELEDRKCSDILENNSTPDTEGQMLFGIVQGGRFEDLRKESAKVIGEMRLDGLAPRSRSDFTGFDGFGIGGSFAKEDMGNAVQWVNEILPEEKPRHLLGIGDPLDLFDAVENGCDLFDCVAPTRQARTGSLYTKRGRFNIENAKYKSDLTPIEEGCKCYTCKNFTKAYVTHLFRSGEILANTLATIHNVHFIAQLVSSMRQGILDGTFFKLKEGFMRTYKN